VVWCWVRIALVVSWWTDARGMETADVAPTSASLRPHSKRASFNPASSRGHDPIIDPGGISQLSDGVHLNLSQRETLYPGFVEFPRHLG
jgi:hypothetical protein